MDAVVRSVEPTAVTVTFRQFDTPFGRYGLHLGIPAAPWSQYFSIIWESNGTTEFLREAILPTGGLELMFNFASDQFLLRDDKPEAYRHYWVSGIQKAPLIIESSGHSHLLGMRLTPLGAWRYFGAPLNQITGAVVESDQVFDAKLDLLFEQMGNAANATDRINALAKHTLDKIARGPKVHYAVAGALQKYYTHNGVVSVGDLVAEFGISHRHFVRLFEQQVGLTPKQCGMLIRFQRVLRAIRSNPTVALGDLALDCGYYDQAHLHKEFRQFSGATPQHFARNHLADETTDTIAL